MDWDNEILSDRYVVANALLNLAAIQLDADV